MKLRIKLLVVALFLCGITHAQVSKESFDKAVDFLNCKTVELSLKGNENIQKYQQDCPCGEANYTQINQFLTSVGKLDATIDLSSEVQNLKKSFKENWKKEDVATFLSEGIFTDKIKYQKIFAFAEKRKGKPEFDTYKATLKTDLVGKLVENVPQENVVPTNSVSEQPTLEDRIAALEKNQKKDNGKGFLGGLADYLILLAVILGIASLFLSLRKQSINDIYNAIIPKILDSKRLKDHIQSQNSSNRHTTASVSKSSELNDAFKRINDLEFQVKNLNDTLSGITTYATQEKQVFQEIKQPEQRTEIFFLSTPNSDGSFNESSASSSYREGATIYRFTKIGSTKAMFQIDEKDASVKLALQYPDKNIDPVCDAENAFNPKATRIITVQPGEAELHGDKWIRKTKAKIRYEN